MFTDDADLTRGGRLFQRRGPATGNARSPYVDCPVRRTIILSDDAELSLYDGFQNLSNRLTEFISSIKLDQSHAGTCTPGRLTCSQFVHELSNNAADAGTV